MSKIGLLTFSIGIERLPVKFLKLAFGTFLIAFSAVEPFKSAARVRKEQG
jgi:hypothetical protein